MYAVVLFFISLADAIMAYTAPVLIQRTVGNATTMGFVFATSSFAGMIMDFSFARLFGDKRSGFFLKILCSLVLLFPLSILAFTVVPSFVFAMVVWGVYFEAMVFANFHSIHEHLSVSDHAWGWGILAVFRNLALVIGPFVASSLFEVSSLYPVITSIVFYVAGIILFLISGLLKTKAYHHAQEQEMRRRTTSQEFHIWAVFEHRLWPLVTLLVLFYFVDSAFMTAGPLLAEKLKNLTPLGFVFVSLYSVPDLVLGFFAAKFAKPFGKKRMAFGAGVVAGVGLMLIGWFDSVFMTFVGNIITAISLLYLRPYLYSFFITVVLFSLFCHWWS
jgi:MFS family permease